MEKEVLNEEIIGVISDSSNCTYETDGFVGDKIYKIGIFYAGEHKKMQKYYIAATEDNMLLTIGTVRNNLDDISAVNMCNDIIKRESQCIDEAAGETVELVYNESDEAVKQPVLLSLLTKEKLVKASNTVKQLSGEVIDWLDELTVMKTAKLSTKEAESYQQEYEKLMSSELIPHEDNSKDYTGATSVFCLICAIISIFFYSMCVMPVITAVASLFSGYRCYTTKNYKGFAICCVAFIVGLVFTYVGWNAFKGSMHIS